MSSDEILIKVADLKVGDEFRMPFDISGIYEGDYVTVVETFEAMAEIYEEVRSSYGTLKMMNVRGYVATRTVLLPSWAYLPVLRMA